jgi:hypothetical protein
MFLDGKAETDSPSISFKIKKNSIGFFKLFKMILQFFGKNKQGKVV